MLEAIERLLGIRGPARGKAGEGRVAKKRFGLAKRKAEADQELKQEQRRIQAFQKRLKRFRYASEGSDESVRPRSSENP